jgi:hypothetical protein
MHVYLVFDVSAYTLDISYYETCIYRLQKNHCNNKNYILCI